ncbi:MAG: TIGR03936 family radical SAM-associated protein, partial [Deltaproteobacteria bacterium]|nr:TIGR03936 family radical SAM-associated protein [Deltaproteobacteria bacterium]
ERIGIEIQRGCNRACRFCQAGYIDRPVRQRSPETVLDIAEKSLAQTGIGEISLLSLSAADYGCIVPLTTELNRRYADDKVSISVPATRTEKLTPELIEQIKKVRKTGFTIAPEAGSARMRRVINKGNLVDDLYRAVTNAFSAGWELLKLYYMVGLPFETDEDVLGIAEEGNGAMEICRRYTPRAELNLSVSSFVPKPFTPFQWEPQMTIDETWGKYNLVKRGLKSRRIRFKHHHAQMSFVEGLLSRGDRRVAGALHLAFLEGCRFDEWEEHFDFSKWEKVFEKWEGDPDFYLHRRRGKDEVLPWDHLYAQMEKTFLWEELERAHDAAREETRPEHRGLKPLPDQLPGFTEDCSVQRCSDCGVCDFREVKNRIFVPGPEGLVAKKGHREWIGWPQIPPDPPFSKGGNQISPEDNYPPLKKGGRGDLYRLRFSKTGDARFMGHLELMDVLKRTLGRLKIPVAFSQGFHPQMKISMGYPLPLGIESEWEFFDLELKEPAENLMQSLNRALPGGVIILSAEPIDRGVPSLYSSLASVSYQAQMPSRGSLARFHEAVEFNWVREKSGKVKTFNLKEVVTIGPEEFPIFKFKTKIDPIGSIGPHDVLTALFGVNQEELSRIGLKKIGVAWREPS